MWLQCFAVYVGVMSAKHPEAIPELMAYMVAVIRACEDFSGLAWIRYDAAYRRQAAASGNRTWSRINPSLFSLCFTGKAQAAKRCDLCLAASHVTKDCSLSADLDPDLPSRLKAVESAVVAFAQSGSGGSERQLKRRPHDDICRVFNEKRCYFRRCRYCHVCLGCTGAHPLIDCPLKQNAGSVRPVSHQQQHPYLPPMHRPVTAECLFQRGLAGSSVKSFLAAIWYSQIAVGLGDPKMAEWPRLGYVVRGFKKKTAGPRSKPRLPITPSILQKLRLVWNDSPDHFNGRMLWAAACMCFFGFLRSGEVVAPGASSFDPSVHLSQGDVAVDSREKPSLVEVKIKASKTDVFRKGVTVTLGATGDMLCPVAAVLGYMAEPNPWKGSPPGPFFVFSNGAPLTREKLVKELRSALGTAGVKADGYAGHFRIAASKGLPDSLIKTLGRWESSAYTLYIRTPQSVLKKVAKSLVGSDHPS